MKVVLKLYKEYGVNKLYGSVIKCFGIIVAIIVLGYTAFSVSAMGFNGIWNMEGYGLCFDINFGFVRGMQVTDSFYTKDRGYKGIVINKTLYSNLGKFKLDKEGDELRLIDVGAQTHYTLHKEGQEFLHRKQEVIKGMPKAAFDMFYEVFNENYAFADLYDVDIEEVYKKYSNLITKETDQETLYHYMCQMVEGLKDGHVTVSYKDNSYSPADYVPEWIKDTAKQEALGKLITTKYVKDYYKFEDCYIRYGNLRQDIGYIIIHAMGMEALNKTASTKKAMDRIMTEFQDKETVVIDLRFNGGGFDEASLFLAGCFASKPHMAYKKQTYTKGSYTKLQEVYVYPQQPTYGGKVVILTSEYTISAAETFLRAMLASQNPQIIVVGEESAGFYSDAIERTLPGGFTFTLSNEVYTGHDDMQLEGQGIVPNVYIPISVKDINNGVDAALDWVLENR